MNTLQQNQILYIGHQLNSNNGRVNLVMQGDGNLVLYRTIFGLPLWSFNTWQKPVNRAVMHCDGNFVAYALDGTPFWDTGTGTILVHLSCFKMTATSSCIDPTNQPLWASNTVQDWISPTVGYTFGHSLLGTSMLTVQQMATQFRSPHESDSSNSRLLRRK